MNNIAFIGCGSISAAHAYGLDNLKYYYKNSAPIHKKYIASRDINKSLVFKDSFNFQESLSIEELFQRDDFDTLFILSSNTSHCEYLLKALEYRHIQNIYLEKPICCSLEELRLIKDKIKNSGKNIQIGFQFLYMSAIHNAFNLWNTLDFGKLINFNARYLHSEYLNKEYRDKRRNRLLGSPAGGALADLGSHALSILVKFIGTELKVLTASHSGYFLDVPKNSDLCSVVSLLDRQSGAIGALTASRINFGCGDQLEFELFAHNGAIKFSTLNPDLFTYCHASTNGNWVTVQCANDFLPDSSFPNINVPSGWLRSLVHAHYTFLFNGIKLADIDHGILVQELILDCITKWENYNE